MVESSDPVEAAGPAVDGAGRGAAGALRVPTPDYAGPLLSDVIPAAALAVGGEDILSPEAAARARRISPDSEARTAVVVLIDGLGSRLLRRRAAHAPFLRSLLPDETLLSAGFPSTTANSLSSLATGLLPGAHGVMGYTLLDPERDEVFNQLTGSEHVDGRLWVPDATLFDRLIAGGIDAVNLGEPKFDGRGLNRGSMRGARFRGSRTLDERVDHALEELRSPGRHVVYLYWGALDKNGHVHGVDAWEWLEELEAIDGSMRRLASSLPRDAVMTVTADHGMIDVPHESRLDLAEHTPQRDLLRAVGGEPRATHLYARAGAEADALAAFRDLVGARGTVLTRAEAVAAGLFGPVREKNLPRIGDLVVIGEPGFGIVDSENDSPAALALVGHHGGVTADELEIPLLTITG
ncbi:alkaline phosphatase family protein [Brevibacterium yomogidense]|uniref:alkaline phosphatase family protein n=1 Tax=Brevibacterium yomogidense TaxID=946573 RepID=UPI0018DFF5BD|nr:nucleotide pyrophosphatase/phosphodiesterase family protein [Brevibacterium yomogidense]